MAKLIKLDVRVVRDVTVQKDMQPVLNAARTCYIQEANSRGLRVVGKVYADVQPLLQEPEKCNITLRARVEPLTEAA